jgi:hypothetical protein
MRIEIKLTGMDQSLLEKLKHGCRLSPVNIQDKAVLPGEYRVLRVLWLDAQLSFVVVPSREWSPRSNRG